MTIQEIDRGPRVALYHLFDAAGSLLYVGITINPTARFADHARKKPWWPEVARKVIDWCDDRGIAIAAEATAIVGEHPVHNDRGKLGLGGGVHRYPPIAYRPPVGVREPLTALSEKTGQGFSVIITEALRRYLGAVADDVTTRPPAAEGASDAASPAR